MQERSNVYDRFPGGCKEDPGMPEKSLQQREMEGTAYNGAHGMKDLRKLYAQMGGMPIVRMPPVRFRDQSFALYGRQIPRVLSYKWGDR